MPWYPQYNSGKNTILSGYYFAHATTVTLLSYTKPEAFSQLKIHQNVFVGGTRPMDPARGACDAPWRLRGSEGSEHPSHCSLPWRLRYVSSRRLDSRQDC